MGFAEALADTPVAEVDLSRHVEVGDDTTVAATVDRMTDARRSAACVVAGDALVGMFTQRDILQRVLGRPASFDRPIREEMTRPVRSMADTQSVADGLAMMNHWWVRSIPVLGDDGRLVGNLSYYAVIQTIAEHLRSRIGMGAVATVEDSLALVDFTGLNVSAPVVVSPDDSVDVAIHHMRARGTGLVVVTDERDNLVGQLTEFDLQMRVGCTEDPLGDISIKDVMDSDPIAVHARAAIVSGIRELLDHQVSHVPLLGESGRPVGVASFQDIAAYVEASLEALG